MQLAGDFAGVRPQSFSKKYRSYSMLMMPGRARTEANKGGKVFLPEVALNELSRLNIEYPMLFSVRSESTGRTTHCGVLEFISDPGICHMPAWMMANLAIDEGNTVSLKNVTLPKGSFAKLQPQSVDFYDISDHRAVLENSLRYFSCLTEGDNFSIDYNNKTYDIVVLKVQPADPSKAISIVETDLQIDFAPAPGMPDESTTPKSGSAPAAPEPVDPKESIEEREQEEIKKNVFRPFTGSGARLDGRAPKTDISQPIVAGPTSEAARREAERLARVKAAQARFAPGKLKFGGYSSAPAPPKTKEDGQPKEEPEPATKPTNSYFSGKGRSLKD